MPTRRGHDDKSSKTHIPRPPNAFILFRSSFIRSNHVPGKVEGNHSTLSKIIGLCWKALPAHERRSWEEKARAAQEEHRNLYPDWRWTPEANALGKKRARKSKKHHDDGDESSQDDPEPSKRKPRGKDKGKARERSHDRDDLDEDIRVAKIADLVKQGKTGAELEKALGEWQATLTPPDPRPAKKRRTSRKQDSASAPSSSRTAVDRTLPPLPSSSTPPAPVSPSPALPPEPPRIHVFRRSPSENSDLTRLTTQSASLITHDASHTPSPTIPLYNSHPTVQPITWSENTTPASYPTSQSTYSQWWSSAPSASCSSPFEPPYDPPEITTDGLGYEQGASFDRDYTEQFGPLSRSHDGSEGAPWSRNTGRNGLCAVIDDPLRECDASPTTNSSPTFPPPVDVVSSPIIPPSPTTFFNPLPPVASSSTSAPAATNTPHFIPSTYSSLTGWAGEYVDHVLSPSIPSGGSWFSTSWQGPQRASTSWGQESDIVSDTSRSGTQRSHHKIIPYQDHNQPPLRPEPTLPVNTNTTIHHPDSNSPLSATP